MTAFPQTSAKITFDQFQLYSLAYLQHRDRLLSATSTAQLSWLTYATGWQWLPALYPGSAFERTACLDRSFSIVLRQPMVETDEVLDELVDDVADESEQPVRQVMTINQTISYSNIWRLPILHFSAFTQTGEPVHMDKLRRLDGVVHSMSALQEESEQEEQGVTPISIADHPRTGLPVYYLHPCNTEAALSAVLQHVEPDQQPQSQDPQGCNYISAFVNLCASAVEMRAS